MLNERQVLSIDDLHDGLENWRNFYRDRTTQRVTLSLEGKYRPSRKDIDYEELLPAPSKPVNASQAIIYEKAIIALPFKFKACLAFEYHYRFALTDKNFNKTCRVAKVAPRDWEYTFRRAKLMLINTLPKAY